MNAPLDVCRRGQALLEISKKRAHQAAVKSPTRDRHSLFLRKSGSSIPKVAKLRHHASILFGGMPFAFDNKERRYFLQKDIGMKNDFDLQRAVQEELYWNPRVNAAAIGVAVNDGIVTLTGHVPQFAERKAAVRSAQRVAGVKGVVDQLEVRLASAGERSDGEIVQAAVNILAWNSFVPAGAIRVTVHDGWITLAGDVEWQYQRMAAEDAVHALWGVRGVTNSIAVRSLREADIVKDHLEAAFQRRARLQGKKITVEVHGQKVTLSGHVDSLDEWEEADAIAWETPGVFAVDNRIVVAFWNAASSASSPAST